MKLSTIILLLILTISVFADSINNDCTSLRIGSRKGATDVMLDGEPTFSYKKYRRIRDDNDVEVDSRDDESTFFISGINLKEIPEIQVNVARDRLATVDSKISRVNGDEDNTQFKVDLTYKCSDNLAGITDVYLTLILDDNTCETVGIRKKCGNKYAYAPIEVSETSYWGLKKVILTENGGSSIHTDNIFDSSNENVVIKKSKKELNFRVTNTASSGGESIDMDPPMVKGINQGETVVYPVLRGAGARPHSLEPGEYTDFKLEFNCVSLDTEAETIEVIFRPSFHSNYVFKVTKECEGLTASGLISKEFQDSLVFDFFAFVLISTLVLAVVSIVFRYYINYKEDKGDDSVRNFFKDFSNRVKSGFNFDEENTQLEMDEIEESPMTNDYEFDPDEILKTNSKGGNSDDFDGDVHVSFDKEDEIDRHTIPDV